MDLVLDILLAPKSNKQHYTLLHWWGLEPCSSAWEVRLLPLSHQYSYDSYDGTLRKSIHLILLNDTQQCTSVSPQDTFVFPSTEEEIFSYLLLCEKAQVLLPLNLGQVCISRSFRTWSTEFLLLPVMTLKFHSLEEKCQCHFKLLVLKSLP